MTKRENPDRVTSRRLASVALGLLALLVAGTVARTTRPEAETGPRGATNDLSVAAVDTFSLDVAVPVSIDTIRRGPLILEVSATGQIAAARRVKIVSRRAGRIASVPFGESAHVSAGRVLAALDPREYALALRAAEADLEEARARYRELTLFDERIEDAQVRAERLRAARARSGLNRAEIALDRARLDLAHTIAPAPFAGRVADVRVTTGEYVTQGQELMTIVDLNPIRVEVAVPESEIRHLSEGAGAAVRLPALPGGDWSGRILSINPVVDPESRTGRVTVELGNPGGEILPGMYARVALESRSFEDRLLVPREAIVERDDRPMVFLFQSVPEGAESGLAKWVYVTPGLENGKVVEIIENEETDLLEAGSLVIVGGHYTLVHDAPVRLAEDPVP
ncbi:MAG: efflux RND transporter periplasmic adaptor subunit [Gemmatimonadota bacterium]|nr:efflux RND transporter periplasmic adaptor subunit [Gemmatimonadota bacterium]